MAERISALVEAASDGRLDAAHLLWGDPAVLRAPQRSARTALTDLRDDLDRLRPLDGKVQEFLDVSAWVLAADPETLGAVWADPRAYFWTGVAHQLVGSCLFGTRLSPLTARYCKAFGETETRRVLASHLDQFKVFALAIACRAGLDVSFDQPLGVELPFAIPGTRWSLDGNGPIRVDGVLRNRLSLVAGDGALALPLDDSASSIPGGITLHTAPVARHAGYEVLVSPHPFNLAGLDVAEPALRAGLGFHARNVALVEQALAHIDHHVPELFAPFRDTIRLIGLKPRRAGAYDDISEPELPGSFIASVVPNALEFADHFIHELQHNRLAIIEEAGPLFDGAWGDATEDTRYFSPWRDKPRALYGIFHGIYVAVALARYWLAVHERRSVAADDRPYVLDRVVRIPLQLALAVRVVDRHAHLTPLGRAILDQLVRDVAAIQERATRIGLPTDAPAFTVTDDGRYQRETSRAGGRPLSVRESVTEHRQRNDPHHQSGHPDQLAGGPA